MYILEIGKRNSNLRQAQTQRKRILKNIECTLLSKTKYLVIYFLLIDT